MTSPRTEIDARPAPPAEPARTTLSATQVVAGALAAVSAAVLASFFGVAGTVIGAALVSVVSTVGSALYGASLNRTTDRLRRTRGTPPAADTDTDADAATRVLPARLDPRRAPAPRRRPRWARVAVYAVAVFATAMAVVTGIELIGQKPVAALVGGTDGPSSSTTIGELSTASSGSDVPPSDPGPATPATDAPATDTGTDAPATPTGEPEQSAPQESAPEESTPEESTPEESTPQESAPDTGGGDGDPGSDETAGTEPAEPTTPEGDAGTGSGSGSTPTG